MGLYSKLPRKFTSPSTFVGTVSGHSLRAQGRIKREAEKRLRKAFAAAGMPTIIHNNGSPDSLELAYEDRLTIHGPLSRAEM